MAFGDRFRRQPKAAAAGQAQYQGFPMNGSQQGPPGFPPAPAPMMQYQAQQQPQQQAYPQNNQAAPPGYYYNEYGQLVPIPRPQYNYQQPVDYPPQQSSQRGQNGEKKSGGMVRIMIPMIVALFMFGGVLAGFYLSFMMTPFVSTTAVMYTPALIALLFMMNGVGLIGLWIRK
jgi:hypothetical protein